MDKLRNFYTQGNFLIIALCVFTALKILLPSVPQLINNLFYVGVLLPCLFIGIQRGFSDGHSRVFYGFFAALAALTMISVFADGKFTSTELFRISRHILYIFAFTLLLRQIAEQRLIFILCIWVSAILASIYSGHVTYTENTFSPFKHRIVSESSIGTAPMLADLIGCFGFYLFARFMTTKCYWQAAMVAFFSVIPLFFLQGRATLLALFIVGLIWLLIDRVALKLKLISLGITLSVVAVTFLSLYFFYDFAFIKEMVERGANGGRLEMWQDLFARLKGCGYVLGCGFDATPESIVHFNGKDTFFNFYHNLFLSALFYVGVLGFITLILFVLKALLIACKNQSAWFYSLIIGVICLQFEGDRLFNNPDSIWLIFWVPLSFCFFANPKNSTKPAKTPVLS